MVTSSFDTRAVLADADKMTVVELKRAIERAAQLGLTQVQAALVAQMDLRRQPVISAMDGGSEALREDFGKTLVEIEKLIGRRNYLRRSLSSRGCKGAIARIVADNSPGGRQTLERLAKAGGLDLALEHLVIRHAMEFDREIVVKASRNLSQHDQLRPDNEKA